MEDSQPSLVHAGNSTTTIPFDLIIEILSRLPAKSLFRFQTVSKLCFSTIRNKFFVDLFLTRSKTRPRLLLTLYLTAAENQFIFSAPEPTDDDKSSSFSGVMARYEMPISAPAYHFLYGCVNGIVCFRGVRCNTIAVYNPTTRQVVKLPDVKTNGRIMEAYLGYDPVEDQYKVLCVIMRFCFGSQDIPQEHWVCTVSSSREWRKMENPTEDEDYRIAFGGTCIDGAVYYAVNHARIVRFDVRSEKIDFIKMPKEYSITYVSIFTNYKGKLGCVDYSCKENWMTLWVLEDAERQEWSSMKCGLPSMREYLLGDFVMTQGMNHTGELMVFNPLFESSKPFYVCYYDFNKESTRKVEIRGLKDGDFRRIHRTDDDHQMLCYPGHIENIRFL
ncbi:unnamed protein product [Eruca vesicaria subsp. sativa]|uniref:F-box domain-containing protein n=1 Tax=Eruca vesicaria subsp. sativa TaxID=29727 RepID=A0ABC8JLS0_ERUVS|nr:unnamed protein product [Eruca vesicaria subsp. sativa]